MNITALRKALAELSIPFSQISGFPDALMVNDRPFIRAATPFNSESVSLFCKDKAALHTMLSGKARMPRTKAFLDPKGSHPELCEASSMDEILASSLDFLYPRVVKMNAGEGGKNVFVAKNESEARSALSAIFDKSSRCYDYIALVQEYIEPAFEYRVAVAAGNPALAYARGAFDPIEGRKKSELFALARTIIGQIGISWGALDFIESKNGDLYFLEANTRPLYGGFAEKNGDAFLVGLYKTALSQYPTWSRFPHTSIGSSSRFSFLRFF